MTLGNSLERYTLQAFTGDTVAAYTALVTISDEYEGEHIGDRLIRFRGKETQPSLAARTGVEQSQISAWESKRIIPSSKSLRKIGKAWGLSAAQLEEGADMTKPGEPIADRDTPPKNKMGKSAAKPTPDVIVSSTLSERGARGAEENADTGGGSNVENPFGLDELRKNPAKFGEKYLDAIHEFRTHRDDVVAELDRILSYAEGLGSALVSRQIAVSANKRPSREATIRSHRGRVHGKAVRKSS